MVVDFSKIDLREQPVLVLKNTTGTPIGVLGSAINLAVDIKYDEASVLEFNIPAQVDGEATPYYDAVIGMRVVDLLGVGQFVLMNPQEVGDGVKKMKSCKGYSLEYEFTFKKITLENATYNFWNPVTPESTLLGIILEAMPSWGVGKIDNSLIGKYRTFEVSDENIYNFIKGTIQTSYNCIFEFDTYNRTINVKDVSSAVATNPIYISNANLAKEITVEECTENIVTRLDVNGADGVNIRDVNPSGDNKIINLDYFMNTDNFDQALINKYFEWKKSYETYQQPYYNLSIEYSLQVMRRTTEQAALVELENERTSLENQQAVIIQSIARNLMEQEDLDDINAKIAEKQTEINEKSAEIRAIQTEIDSIFDELKEINDACRFESWFTKDEYLQLDRYIKDDAVSESSFVLKETSSYSDEDVGNAVENKTFSITGSEINSVTNSRDKDIYDIKGGILESDNIKSEIIKAAFERKQDDSFVMTAYLGGGTIEDNEFITACLSLTGTVLTVSTDAIEEPEFPNIKKGTELTVAVKSGYLYFTRNTSEYEKRSVAWELFEYGNDILKKISQPSYTFGVTSANFICAEDFEKFKNELRIGEKLYIGISEDETLSPICVGIRLSYDSPNDLTMEFSDTYVSGESSFLLADLLEQSVSMGKSVDLSKYTYSAFVDSGASTKVKDFMNSALDVSKNAIISSKSQAISWGDSGIRLRKWTDNTQTEYDPKQVWLNNNSMLMTSNNWATAEMAIGNFYDPNLGDCWGVVAPNIVGTLLAGENLVIESLKKDGGVAVFKVDAEGCFLHNSNFSITGDGLSSQILLDPEHGLIIGKYPLIDNEGTLTDDNKLFYADTEGNLTLKGTIYAEAGEFTGKITALEGYIGTPSEGWTIGSSAIYNGKKTFSSTDAGVYLGVDGFSLGDNDSFIKASSEGKFIANDAVITGNITATSGEIGGCTIKNGVLEIANANITSINADKIYGGTIDADDVDIINLNASNITSGVIDADDIEVINLNASNITGGTINGSTVDVTNLNASNITTGTLTVGGTSIDPVLLQGTISGNTAVSGLEIKDLKAENITAGTLKSVNIEWGGKETDGTLVTYGSLIGSKETIGITSEASTLWMHSKKNAHLGAMTDIDIQAVGKIIIGTGGEDGALRLNLIEPIYDGATATDGGVTVSIAPYNLSCLRNSYAGTEDMTEGESTLKNGTIYFVMSS